MSFVEEPGKTGGFVGIGAQCLVSEDKPGERDLEELLKRIPPDDRRAVLAAIVEIGNSYQNGCDASHRTNLVASGAIH